MARFFRKRSGKRSSVYRKDTSLDDRADIAQYNSPGIFKRKSISSVDSGKVSKTDDADLSPTSVESPVISVTQNHEAQSRIIPSGMAFEVMNTCIDLVGDEDFDVPADVGENDFDVPVKVDCEYEEAAPSRKRYYGYSDESSDDSQATYGHGDVSPNGKAKYGFGDSVPDEKSKYGYEDAAPDDRSKYGYREASPDEKAKYGYEDAAPDEKFNYGFGGKKSRMPVRRRTLGDTADDESSCDTSRLSLGSTRSTMRSSMKKFGGRRRASIQLGAEISIYLPGKTEPVKRRTSITFNESVKVKKVESVTSLASAPEALWFQDEEFKAIRRRSLDLVDKYENGDTKGKKYCIRGLEKMLKTRRKIVMERKYDAWDTVLDEQDIQRDSGTWDEEYMADVYKHLTAQPLEEAAAQGQKDYEEIENYMKSTRKLCRRLST